MNVFAITLICVYPSVSVDQPSLSELFIVLYPQPMETMLFDLIFQIRYACVLCAVTYIYSLLYGIPVFYQWGMDCCVGNIEMDESSSLVALQSC